MRFPPSNAGSRLSGVVTLRRVKWDGFRAVVSTERPLTGAESARRMALVVFPLADTAACYCANEFSLREVQQGVLAGAELLQ
jgi:hypothetical protein